MDDKTVKKILLTSAISTALLCGSMTASAGDFYVGAGFGSTSVDASASDLDDGSFTSASVDDSDTMFRLFGGYKINDSIAIEAGYIDLGSASLEAESDGSGTVYSAGNIKANVDIDGWEFSAVGSLPINNQFSVLGRIGFLKWDTDGTLNTSVDTYTASDDGTDLLYGIGGAYSFTDNLDARLEYTRYDADDDIDVFSASLVMQF